MKTPSTAPLPLSPSDRPTRRSSEYIDNGWDELFTDDAVADYGGRSARLADEDNAW